MLPTLLLRNGLQMQQRDLSKLFTSTNGVSSKEIIIDPEELDVEQAIPTDFTPMELSESGVGGHEYITYPSHIPHDPGSTEITVAAPPPPEYTSKVDDLIPNTINDKISLDCPAVKPILEVSCVDRTRLLWNDFKITWGPAWNDQAGCRRLYTELDKRGLVTGFHCAQIADQESNTWLMEARGHRPRFPRTLVADAIRATFSHVSTELLCYIHLRSQSGHHF